MESESNEFLICSMCDLGEDADHTLCNVLFARRAESINPQVGDRRAYLLSQNPWLGDFLEKYAIWQEQRPNSES